MRIATIQLVAVKLIKIVIVKKMKHIFTLTLLIALYVVGYSQCINNTSTNPKDPRNEVFLPWVNDNIPGGGLLPTIRF
jgi:hypothetical protein